MRVIDKDTGQNRTSKCHHCGSLIEYVDGELSEGRTYDYTLELKSWTQYFFCPVCKHKVVVNVAVYE